MVRLCAAEGLGYVLRTAEGLGYDCGGVRLCTAYCGVVRLCAAEGLSYALRRG